MKEDQINLLAPHLSGLEEEYVKKAFLDNEIAGAGSNINEFGQKLKDYLEKPMHVALLNSGTSALHLALLILGVEKEDEVICQSFTFCASANPILYLGARPIFVDSETSTWNMSPEFLEIAVKDRIKKGKKPKAIIVVDSYGMPAKWKEIKRIANEYEIPIIEDAAEALGSEYGNQKCGTFGDISIVSFNSNKIITTSGGGALVCNNESYSKKALFLATQAKEKETFYLHKEPGYNYVMSNVIAGIGSAQIDLLEERLNQKKMIHSFYKGVFREVEGYTLLDSEDPLYSSNHWLNCVLVDPNKTSVSNTELKEALYKKRVETRFLWYPLHKQPVHKDSIFYGDNTCVEIFSKGICLPSSTFLQSAELKRIKSVFDSYT